MNSSNVNSNSQQPQPLQLPLEAQDFIDALAAQLTQANVNLANAQAAVRGISRQLDFAQSRIVELEKEISTLKAPKDKE